MLDDKALELLNRFRPHRLTLHGSARMVVRHGVDPFTGRLDGTHYVDPIFVAGLLSQGRDPEPLVKALLAAEAEQCFLRREHTEARPD